MIDELQRMYGKAEENDKGYFVKEIALLDDIYTGRRTLWVEVYLSSG